LLYAVAYWAVGIKGIDPNASSLTVLGNSLYLSVITFSTVGFGDYHPANLPGKMLAASEGLLGIFFTGLFLVTFVKKYSR
jgi:hypothetical protein